jgi:hypothetical protein
MKIEPRSPLPSPKQAKPGKPKTPDEYLSALSDDQRGALEDESRLEVLSFTVRAGAIKRRVAKNRLQGKKVADG